MNKKDRQEINDIIQRELYLTGWQGSLEDLGSGYKIKLEIEEGCTMNEKERVGDDILALVKALEQVLYKI